MVHSESQVKASILNDQFSSVFTKEDVTSTIPSLGHSMHPDLARITVSEEGVQKLLGGLKIHSGLYRYPRKGRELVNPTTGLYH